MSIKVKYEPERIAFPIVTYIDNERCFYTPAAAKELRDKLDAAIIEYESHQAGKPLPILPDTLLV